MPDDLLRQLGTLIVPTSRMSSPDIVAPGYCVISLAAARTATRSSAKQGQLYAGSNR